MCLRMRLGNTLLTLLAHDITKTSDIYNFIEISHSGCDLIRPQEHGKVVFLVVSLGLSFYDTLNLN